MSKISQDYTTIYASGNIPAAATASSALDIRNHDGVNLIVDVRGGGYAGLLIKPQFSFDTIALDADRQDILPTSANQEWSSATTGTLAALHNVVNTREYVTNVIIGSGVIARRFIAYNSPGATAMRFTVQGSGLVGPDTGAIQLKAARVQDHQTGKGLR